MLVITRADGSREVIAPIDCTPRAVVTECPVCYGRPCVAPKFCPGSK